LHQRTGHPQQIVPVVQNLVAVDPPFEPRPQARVSLLTLHAKQSLVPQVADARGELQTEQVEQGEDDLGKAGRVGRVLQERQLRLVVEDLVEHVGRIPHRGGDDFRAVLENWSAVQV